MSPSSLWPTSGIVIVDTFPNDASSTPFLNQLIVIGGVPLAMSQTIVTSFPPRTYTGVPTSTVLSPGVIGSGCGSNGPSSMSGGSPNNQRESQFYLIYSNSMQNTDQ